LRDASPNPLQKRGLLEKKFFGSITVEFKSSPLERIIHDYNCILKAFMRAAPFR